MKSLFRLAAMFLAASAILVPGAAAAQSDRGLDARSARAVQHWTPERRAAAIPRDFVIDERGLAYIRDRNGRLIPHGHDIQAQAAPGGDFAAPRYSHGAGGVARHGLRDAAEHGSSQCGAAL